VGVDRVPGAVVGGSGLEVASGRPERLFDLEEPPAQQVVDRLVGTVVAPPGEAVVRRAAGRQVVRRVIPLAAGPALVDDRVDDLPYRIAALVAADRGSAAFHAVITGSIKAHRSSDKSLG
jgi:hypothetical protein